MTYWSLLNVFQINTNMLFKSLGKDPTEIYEELPIFFQNLEVVIFSPWYVFAYFGS